MTHRQTQKIGINKGSRRICLWNKIMVEMGFSIGQPISIKSDGQMLTIQPTNESPKKVSGVKNHGKVLPVIDIKENKNLVLSDLGNVGDLVEVKFSKRKIVISRTN